MQRAQEAQVVGQAKHAQQRGLVVRLEQAFRGGGRAGGFVEQPQEAQVVGQALKYQSLHQLGQLFDAGRACIAEGQLGRAFRWPSEEADAQEASCSGPRKRKLLVSARCMPA